MTSTVMSAQEIPRTLRRMAHELVELNEGVGDVVMLGVITRGVPLAQRLADELFAAEGVEVPVGQLDITMYRDDLHRHPTRPVGRTVVPCAIDDARVVLVDDVIFSGRTIQAALHALADLGRPASIRLATLIDRGGRQLPIHPDIVGKSVPASKSERVFVRVEELDGTDAVRIEREDS